MNAFKACCKIENVVAHYLHFPDQSFEIKKQLAYDGLTITYLSELVDNSESNDINNSNSYIIREYLSGGFPSEKECRKYWLKSIELWQIIQSSPELRPYFLNYLESKELRANNAQHNRFFLIFKGDNNFITLKDWSLQIQNLNSSNEGKNLQSESFSDEDPNLSEKSDDFISMASSQLSIESSYSKEYSIYSSVQLDQIVLKNVISPILKAIHNLHLKGYVHRDINPNTIFMHKIGIKELKTKTSDSKKIISIPIYAPIIVSLLSVEKIEPLQDVFKIPDDLDLLPPGQDRLTTPGFFAPEIALGKSARASTDIYEIGALTFFLLTGHTRNSERSEEDFILSISDEISYSPPELDEILRKATQFEPALRYNSCLEMLQDVNLYLQKDFDALKYLLIQSDEKIDRIGLVLELTKSHEEIFIPIDLPKITLENGGFFRFGRELCPDDNVFDVITPLGPESEQFSLGYSSLQDKFLLYEGRNTNQTLINGEPLPQGRWIEWDFSKPLSFSIPPDILIYLGIKKEKI